MIKTKDIRNHIPRLKMGKHHIFAGQLNEFLDQQEKVINVLNEVKQLLIDMSIDFDEYGMEPTTTTLRSGQEIKDTWFHKIMNKLESESNDQNNQNH